MATYKVKRDDSKSLNEFSEFKKTRLEMNMQMVPHARWGAGEHYFVKGFGNALFTGMYRFDKVVHEISADGYTVDVDAVRVPMPTSTPKTSGNNSSNTKRKKDIVYIVRKDDNLWTILKKYGRNPLKYRELAKFNKIKNPHLIFPNDKVIIPPNI